jgi:hypothetical protein
VTEIPGRVGLDAAREAAGDSKRRNTLDLPEKGIRRAILLLHRFSFGEELSDLNQTSEGIQEDLTRGLNTAIVRVACLVAPRSNIVKDGHPAGKTPDSTSSNSSMSQQDQLPMLDACSLLECRPCRDELEYNQSKSAATTKGNQTCVKRHQSPADGGC